MASRPQRAGLKAEELAFSYLCKQGLKPVTRNFRSKLGEIDLIMQDRNAIVFIEVRFRKQNRFGSAAESVDFRKQNKLTATALYFLQRFPRWQNRPARFDVVAISSDMSETGIGWIKDAFQT